MFFLKQPPYIRALVANAQMRFAQNVHQEFSKIKSSMMQEVSRDEEQRLQKKKMSTASKCNDDHCIMPEGDIEEETVEIKNNIYSNYKNILQKPNRSETADSVEALRSVVEGKRNR
ncbi:hypothetical protein BDF21DRAFT_401193 [Thamnidium elegans]|nr:hypothetical protein BDF21DRAFT_401193 [Thamnidium elegans]